MRRLLLLFFIFLVFGRAFAQECPQLSLSLSERESYLREKFGYSGEVATRVAADDAAFARVVCGISTSSRRPPNTALKEGKTGQGQQKEKKRKSFWPRYEDRLSREEIRRIRQEAWEYRKWVTEPVYRHKGRSRFVLQTIDPIPVRCAVGYSLVLVLPFQVASDGVVLGNPDAFRARVFTDGRTIQISAIKPFQSTNITVRAKDLRGPEKMLTFYVEEVYDQPQADYVVWVVGRNEVKVPDEEKLLEFAIEGSSQVFDDELFVKLARPFCISRPSWNKAYRLIRTCYLSAPEKIRLLVFEGAAHCEGNCLFEAILEKKTIIGVRGNEKVRVCLPSGDCPRF